MNKQLKTMFKKLLSFVLPLSFQNKLRILSSIYRYYVHEIALSTFTIENDGFCDEEYTSQCLRRYAHIIDKGLQHDDWEPGHSLNFFTSACNAIKMITDTKMANDPSVLWAGEVVDDYRKQSRRSKQHYQSFCESDNFSTYEQLVSIIRTRRSIRHFTDRPVDIHIIRKIVDTINWSPTSCNRQPAKVFLTTDPLLAKECLATCKGGTGFSQSVPCFLSFCAYVKGYDFPNEFLMPTIDVALGVQNCCLTSHSFGLSLVLLSWAQHDVEENTKLRKLLDIPSNCQIVVNGVLGYPSSSVPPPLRKGIDCTCILRSRIS